MRLTFDEIMQSQRGVIGTGTTNLLKDGRRRLELFPRGVSGAIRGDSLPSTPIQPRYRRHLTPHSPLLVMIALSLRIYG